ncbi:MAG: hypothetical protein RIS94_2664 [Pseudomonadota bacterium]|jgi:hypothetical protein
MQSLGRALVRKGWWIVPLLGAAAVLAPHGPFARRSAAPALEHGVRVTRAHGGSSTSGAADMLQQARGLVPVDMLAGVPGVAAGGGNDGPVRVSRHH